MPQISSRRTTENPSFDDFYLSDEMRRALKSVGYEEPTRVQVEAIPLILAGIDLTLQSQTGSGKTAAFAIPVIEMLEPKPGRIDVLAITPTRELAKQVCNEFERLGQFKDLEATPIYGGMSYERQFDALESASIVVATPGRLLDLCERGKIDLSQLQMLVLDEADEMLSMGFLDDIEAVIDYCPEERQSLLCSATITREIKSLANSILFHPEFVSLSSDNVAARSVTHEYYNVRGVGRPRDLIKVLEYEQPDSALIFANTRKDTFSVTSFLKRHGYRAAVLNGELAQKDREKTLESLRKGEIDFIVATDVAARGIDISDLSHVINYALPDSAEVYVHRTGRTGRAGKSGKAISLVAPTEVDTFFQIKKMYEIALQERTLPTTAEIMEARQKNALYNLDRQLAEIDYLPYGGHLKLARELLEGGDELDDRIEGDKLVARLLSLAERVVDGEFQRRTNGRGPATTTSDANSDAKRRDASSKPDAASAKKKSTDSKKKPKKEKKEKKASKKDDTKKRRRTRKSDSTSSDDDGQKTRRRRRRRNRDDKSQDQSKQQTTSPTQSDEEEDMDQIESAAPTVDSPSATKKMYMNIGRNAFDSAKELVDMLCFMSGMDPEDFGKVSVESSFSFIHIREDYFDDVIAALHGQKWEGHKITAEPARN